MEDNCTNNKPTSEALAAMIVAYKSLGLFKESAKQAMIELDRRKNEDKDPFDYESFISQKLSEIPKSELNPEIMSALSAISVIGSVK